MTADAVRFNVQCQPQGRKEIMEIEEQKVKDKFKSIFDAYLQLQSESYEFITRTIAMHNWLREAYRLLQEQPGLSAEETYQAWQPTFGRIYTHLFAAFLRPYRVMMFPFGEFLRAQTESLTPQTLGDTYLDSFRLWGEAQVRSLNGISSAFQRFSEEDSIDAVQELTPLKLMRNIADEETIAYFETLEQFLGYFGESQFLVPKTFILYLQKFISSYPKAYQLAQRYEAMFRDTWEKSLQRFTFEIKKGTGPAVEFKEFFNTYVSIFALEYDQLLRSPEFIEVQNGFVTMNLDVTASMRKAMEAQLDMFPSLPFVTGGEMDALAKRVHSHKSRLDSLERQMRDLEHKLITVSERAELKRPARKVAGKMEAKKAGEAIK
jgi:BMFP domain-containing protein YqiC